MISPTPLFSSKVFPSIYIWWQVQKAAQEILNAMRWVSRGNRKSRGRNIIESMLMVSDNSINKT